jgi:hypothetical protein
MHVRLWEAHKPLLQADARKAHWLSTHWHAPPFAPAGTHAQNGDSSGHDPPQIAEPAAGSPWTIPHVTGGGRRDRAGELLDAIKGGGARRSSGEDVSVPIHRNARIVNELSVSVAIAAQCGAEVPVGIEDLDAGISVVRYEDVSEGINSQIIQKGPKLANCPSPPPPIPN